MTIETETPVVPQQVRDSRALRAPPGAVASAFLQRPPSSAPAAGQRSRIRRLPRIQIVHPAVRHSTAAPTARSSIQDHDSSAASPLMPASRAKPRPISAACSNPSPFGTSSQPGQRWKRAPAARRMQDPPSTRFLKNRNRHARRRLVKPSGFASEGCSAGQGPAPSLKGCRAARLGSAKRVVWATDPTLETAAEHRFVEIHGHPFRTGVPGTTFFTG